MLAEESVYLWMYHGKGTGRSESEMNGIEPLFIKRRMSC